MKNLGVLLEKHKWNEVKDYYSYPFILVHCVFCAIYSVHLKINLYLKKIFFVLDFGT